jgi:hypothetical protein
MNESNPFASLSSTLLARKGHAKPAMRPQGFHVHHETDPEALEDLGWNDMGQEAKSPRVVALTPAAIEVPEEAPVPIQQQAELAREFAPPFIAPRALAGSKAKAAFTLRLDTERHLRLRLVCAVNHRSAQQIVTLALDEFLARQPGNETLTQSTGDQR